MNGLWKAEVIKKHNVCPLTEVKCEREEVILVKDYQSTSIREKKKKNVHRLIVYNKSCNVP